MKEIFELFLLFIQFVIFIYASILLLSYVVLGIIALRETIKYIHKNSFINYTVLSKSSNVPSISVLAPAYNEGENIIDNVRSLLTVNYLNLEIIVINDGSKDDSLEKLIKEYELVPVNYYYQEKIKSSKVNAIYKSKNIVFKKLIVVDKVNGGKADALNVGINVSSNQFVVSIDVDCILEQNALLKMIKPFLENPKTTTIATGGVIRIANSCMVESGRVVDIRLPVKLLPRIQTLEYVRAFILGRMAWSKLNGLLIISGAFGMFDKKVVLEAGGYNVHTVGEDMELVVRMRRMMQERSQKYRVAYIPDPLCWTEAPDNYTILGRQRNRWARGTHETLMAHRTMFFNRKYGTLGMISYPYWFFFEYLAPMIEFFGLLFFIFLTIIGMVNWEYTILLTLFLASYGMMFSSFAILAEEIAYHQYNKRKDLLNLLLSAIYEPFVFHAFGVYSALSGHYQKIIKGATGWGNMTRQGFTKNNTK